MQPERERFGVKYKHYLLGLLTVILLFNYVDRFALALLLQNIKLDLQLSDTQLGLLSGIAFALFYSVMGVPIARWADRGNRVTIVTLTAALWSVAVMLCGMANSFRQLLVVRVGVAVGEAGCIAPAFSLIADYFDRAERPRAVLIYGLGGPLSTLVGFFLAGWLSEQFGWRATFMMLGLPGLLLAALAWFTLREPRLQDGRIGRARTAPIPPKLSRVFMTLWKIRTFRSLLLCLSVSSFFGYGIVQWQPTFFIRSHGLSTSELGLWLTLIYGGGGVVGTFLVAELITRFAPSDEALQLKGMALAFVFAGVCSVLVYCARTEVAAFIFLALLWISLMSGNGPLFSTIQTLVPDEMRAVAFSIVYLFSNLIGMGFGPLATGLLSDAFRPWAGEESLRYALIALSPGYLWVAWFAWRSGQTALRDISLSLDPPPSNVAVAEAG